MQNFSDPTRKPTATRHVTRWFCGTHAKWYRRQTFWNFETKKIEHENEEVTP